MAKHKERVWRTRSVFTLHTLGLSEVFQLLGMIAVPLLGGTTAFISYSLPLKRKTSKCIYYLWRCVHTRDEGRHGLGKSFGCRCCISPRAPRPYSAIPAEVCMVAGGTHFGNKKSSETAHSFHPRHRSQTENLCVNIQKWRSPLTRRLCSSKIISFSLKFQFAVPEHCQGL